MSLLTHCSSPSGFFSPTSWFLLPSPPLAPVPLLSLPLLSGLLTFLPTLPQEQYGLLRAESDCFWLPSLSELSLQMLQRKCFVSRMGVLFTSKGISKPGSVFSEFQLLGQQSLLFPKSLPLEGSRLKQNCEWEEEVTLAPFGWLPPVLLRAWLKSLGRDQVSPALGAEEGRREAQTRWDSQISRR